MNKALKICRLIGLCILLNAATCAAGALNIPGIAGGTYAVPVTSLKAVRYTTTLQQQYDFSCGSAAVATLLTHHYGYPISEQVVFQQMYERGDQQKIRKEGFSLLDMKLFLETHGFQADGFQEPLEKLEGAGLPAIALIADKGYYHFIVIKGIRDGRVLIGDPSSGTRAISRASFESMWINNLLFVIHNRQDLAGFNKTADWRAAPKAPIQHGIHHHGLNMVPIPKLGHRDF